MHQDIDQGCGGRALRGVREVLYVDSVVHVVLVVGRVEVLAIPARREVVGGE